MERFEIVRRIAGPRSFSQWVFLPILMTLSAGTSLPELQGGVSTFYAWNSIAASALALSWAFASAMGMLINAVFRKVTLVRFFAVVTVFFVTESGRAVLVAAAADALALDGSPNWPYRIVAGGLTGLALFGLAAYLVDEAAEYRRNLGELTSAQRSLSETVLATASDLEIRRVQLLEQVRTAITDSIRSVLSAGGSSARDVANELVRVSENVVRPLSHSLVGAEESELSRADAPVPRISFRAVMDFATTIRPFRPEAVTIFAIMLVSGGVLLLWPVEIVPAFLALLVWVYGYLSVMRWKVTPRLRSIRLTWRVCILMVAYVGFAIVPGLFVLVATNRLTSESWPYFFYILVIAQIVLWPLAVISGVTEARNAVLSDVRVSNQRLVWARARLASHLWGQRNNIALALHKDVQGTLLASAMKLKMSRDAHKNDAAAIDEIRATVLDAAEFVVAPVESPPIAAAIEMLASRWRGIIQLDFECSTNCRDRIDGDAIARRIVIDLFSEAVTNAVKHGQATAVRVAATELTSDVLSIESINDGRHVELASSTGLGTRMLSAVSIDRGIENVSDGVRVWANIPVVQLV